MSLQNAAIDRLSHVEGVVNYLKRKAEKPRTYRFDRIDGSTRIFSNLMPR